MKLRRSAKRKKAGVDTSLWWEFQPGDRVLTVEGIFGRVIDVEDGPHAGNEQYIVELDMDLGGGAYASSELRNPDSDSVEPGFGGVQASKVAAEKCPLSEKKSTRWPGTKDQCEHCGRVVATRSDGTYAKHNMPSGDDDLPPGESIVPINRESKIASPAKVRIPASGLEGSDGVPMM